MKSLETRTKTHFDVENYFDIGKKRPYSSSVWELRTFQSD